MKFSFDIMTNNIFLKMDEFIECFVVVCQKPRSDWIRLGVEAEDSQHCYYTDDEEYAEGGRSSVIVNSDGLLLKKRV